MRTLRLASRAAPWAFLAVAAVSGCRCNRGKPAVRGMCSTNARPLMARLLEEYARSGVENYVDVATTDLAPNESARRRLASQAVDYFVTEGPIPLVDQPALASRPVAVPIAIGGVAVVYNLPEVDGLAIGRTALTDVFLGKISRWNDPALASANVGRTLPDAPIVVVYRTDQSGTTALFTQYAAAVSAEWKAKVGEGITVQWPAGKGVVGGDALIEAVRSTRGAIAILPLPVAANAKLAIASLGNQAGRYVLPSSETLTAAGIGASWSPGEMPPSLADRAGERAYPIGGFIYVVFQEAAMMRSKVEGLATFLTWAMRDGQRSIGDLPYGMLPSAASDAFERPLKQLSTDNWAPPAL